MRYLIKQKIFSIGDKFTIRDENENPRYEVVGKVFTLGKKLDLYDIQGNHLIYIEQKLFRFLPEYNIYRDGVFLAQVKKEFTFFKPRFNIDSQYGNFDIDGDVFAHEFNIYKDGRIVASVSKKWISWSDTYTVDINNEEDQAFILSLVIVLDQVHHDNTGNAGSHNHN